MNAEQFCRNLTDTILNDPPSLEETPDVVADLERAAKILNETRRMLMSEVTAPVEGREFKIKEARSAKRSYNTSGLLSAFGGYSALPELVAKDVVRISWQWSNLRREATARDIPLVIEAHEISDGDDSLVGEVWASSWTVTPK